MLRVLAIVVVLSTMALPGCLDLDAGPVVPEERFVTRERTDTHTGEIVASSSLGGISTNANAVRAALDVPANFTSANVTVEWAGQVNGDLEVAFTSGTGATFIATLDSNPWSFAFDGHDARIANATGVSLHPVDGAATNVQWTVTMVYGIPVRAS